jgi:hypothetical protein
VSIFWVGEKFLDPFLRNVEQNTCYIQVNSRKNLMSYSGLVDESMNSSDKEKSKIFCENSGAQKLFKCSFRIDFNPLCGGCLQKIKRAKF